MSLNFVGFNEFGTQSLMTQSKRWRRERVGEEVLPLENKALLDDRFQK